MVDSHDSPAPKQRVLLVEDEEAHASLIRRAFRRQAPEIVLDVAQDLAGARYFLSKQHVDLIISDLNLPDGKGIDLVQAAPGEDGLRPLVVMTSFGDETEAVRALKAGALDYVVKSEYSLGDMPHLALRALREWEYILEKRRKDDQVRILSHAVEQSSSSLLITDVHGKIQYVNPKFTQITGYGLEDVRGKTPRLLRSCRASAIDYAQLWETILSGRPWRGVFLNSRRTGEDYWEDNIISPIRDSQDRITHFLAVKEDITETLKAREEFARLEQQLRVSQKIQTIGTLAGGIAHDFNNILTPIFGFANMAMAALPEEHAARKDMAHVLKAAERARDLVRQILTFSRQGSSSRELLRLNTIVKEVLKLIRAGLPATIEIETHVSEDTLPALADASQIHQVLMNLCANAAHAMKDKGGRLTVRLCTWETETEEVRKHPALGQHEIWVLLEVKDTGHGISHEILERIFEPFFTTKPVGEGTGLGLAVVHGIVSGHGGEIFVDSELGKGTIVRVFLPPVIEHAHADKPKGSEHILVKGNGEHILLVDDEPEITSMVKQILGILGYKVTERNKSVEALELFRASPEKYDLLLTDQTMPDLTGLMLAEKVLQIRPGFPIILLSGYSEHADSDKIKVKGITEFLLKPVVLADLATAVRKVLSSQQH